MASYHISDDGNPRLCKAASGNCPYGSAEDHHGTKEAARRNYEINQELPSAAQNFSTTMIAGIEHIDDNLRVPKQIAGHRSDLNFSLWLEKEISSHSLKLTKEMLFPNEYLTVNREVLKSFSKINLNSNKFWSDYFTRFTKTLNKIRRHQEPVTYPENFVVSNSDQQMGDPETAQEFISILRNWKTEELSVRYNHDQEFRQEIENHGFSYVGSGMQQFVVKKNGILWKTQGYNLKDSDGREYVYQFMAAIEIFPESERLTHAKTSGYSFGEFGVIAQEEVFPSKNKGKVSQKDLLTLQLYGHWDFDLGEAKRNRGNFVIQEDRIVCYDTAGDKPTDMKTHLLKNLKSL